MIHESTDQTTLDTDTEQNAQISSLKRKLVGAWTIAVIGPLIATAGLLIAVLSWRATDGQRSAAEGQLRVMKAQLEMAQRTASQAQSHESAVIAAANRQAESLKNLAEANKKISDISTKSLAASEKTARAASDAALASKDMAASASISAQNSGKAIESAQSQLRINLKPSLSGEGAFGGRHHEHLTIEPGQMTPFFVFMKNTGRGTAIGVRLFACGFLLVGGEPPFDIPCKSALPAPDMDAGASAWIQLQYPPFTPNEVIEIKEGKRRLYVFYGADYQDEFRTQYHFSACEVAGDEVMPYTGGGMATCSTPHFVHEAKNGDHAY
jgi:hypothetical protein